MSITGDLTITAGDGTTLRASSDLRLAWQWAEHEHGDEWANLSYGEQCREVSAALAALREAARASGT